MRPQQQSSQPWKSEEALRLAEHHMHVFHHVVVRVGGLVLLSYVLPRSVVHACMSGGILEYIDTAGCLKDRSKLSGLQANKLRVRLASTQLREGCYQQGPGHLLCF